MARRLLTFLKDQLQKRTSAAVGVLLITALAAAAIPFLAFDTRIDVMFPDGSELRTLFSFLREIQVADKVLVTFATRDGSSNPAALIAAADRYAAELDPSIASPVQTGLSSDELSRDFVRLAHQLPEYMEPADLDSLATDTSAAGIRNALGALRRRLQQPEGMFGSAAARADPLDWNNRVVKKILSVVAAFGYRAVPVQQHLMDQDRRHLLMILKTPILMTDTTGTRRLLQHLNTCGADLPPGITTELVCGHLHTAGNEAVIRRDITVTSIAIMIAFLVLFLGVYRDMRAVAIVMIPVLASVPALAVAASLFERFSVIVIGFGSVIVGIAIDYGIHTYVVSRGPQAADTLKRIRRPVTLSALTTLCVFAAFSFSSIPAYRQLGLFASLAILLSLAYAFWLLPLWIKPAPPPPAPPPGATEPPAYPRTTLIVAALILASGIALASRLHFDPDVSKLDGTPPATLANERRALATWGGGESLSAILCVDAPDEAQALVLNDTLYQGLLAANLPPAEISSLAPVCPSDRTRRQRRQAWNAFWTDARALSFRQSLEQAADQLDFSAQAFRPFWDLFDGWRNLAPLPPTAPIGFLAPLRDHFIHSQDGRTRVLTFIPDTPACLDAARKLVPAIPSLRVISRRAFSQSLSDTISREVVKISWLAACLIVAVTLAVIRHVGRTVTAAIPAVVGMVWGGAGMALFGLPLNISNMIAGIIVLGLCIDYGICMVYAQLRDMQRDVSRAVVLSALTTVLGAGVLLFARHPAFFSIGVTLVFGVSAGYLCARFVIPSLQALWPGHNPRPTAPDPERGAS